MFLILNQQKPSTWSWCFVKGFQPSQVDPTSPRISVHGKFAYGKCVQGICPWSLQLQCGFESPYICIYTNACVVCFFDCTCVMWIYMSDVYITPTITYSRGLQLCLLPRFAQHAWLAKQYHILHPQQLQPSNHHWCFGWGKKPHTGNCKKKLKCLHGLQGRGTNTCQNPFLQKSMGTCVNV